MLRTHIENSDDTQRVWAQRLGITASHLSSLMSGNKMPSLALAFKIERLTGGAVPASSWVARAISDPVDHSKPSMPGDAA